MHEIDWNQAPWRNRENNSDKNNLDPHEPMKKWYQLHGVPETELTGPIFPGMGSDSNGKKKSRNNTRSQWDPSSLPKPDLLLNGTEVFSTGKFSVRTIWTPGHTPGHICFYEESARVIFTGDHILPKITPNVSIRGSRESDPLADYIDSINKLKDLEVEWVFPAHEHEFPDLGKRLDDLLTHHESRVQEIIDAVKPETHSAYEVASNVSWNVGDWKDMDRFLRRSATGETLSHLEYLKNQKKLSSVKDPDGIVRWSYSEG
jgi:glyoxylase-like metal-dependent hydrolase (beta-lactamase superfamily II)